MHKGTTVSQPGQRRGSEGTALTLLEVEVVWCLGRPESHGVHSVVLVSRHWGVVRHGKDNLERTIFPSGYSTVVPENVGQWLKPLQEESRGQRQVLAVEGISPH